jgi:hypothetical protein
MNFIKLAPAGQSHVVKENGDIMLPDKTVIKKFVMDADKILNRSIVFYGPSKTGKSFAIMHFLEIIASRVEKAIVICPSDTRDYKKVIPLTCISSEISFSKGDVAPKKKKKNARLDEMQEYLSELIDIQHRHTEVYKKTINLDNLWEIYAHIKSGKHKDAFDKFISNLKYIHKKALKKIEESTEYTPVQKKDYIDCIIEIYNKNLLKLLQDYIRYNEENIKSSLSTELRDLIQYIGINPNLVLVLDDMGADLPEISKLIEFRKLFFRGRHLSVTLFISCQTDKSLVTELRANAFFSIFTDIKAAKTMITRPTSNLDEEVKKSLLKAVPYIFGIEYVKLLYCREEEAYYNYKATPSLPYRFKVGSEAYWELAGALEFDSVETASDLFSKFR